MARRTNLMAVALAGLLTREAQAVLAPEHVEAEKSSAAYHLTIQVVAVERVEASRTGGLDSGRATGTVVSVRRAPRAAPRLGSGDPVAFDVPVWAWSVRDREPPGPDRLYWGVDAPRERVDVWGSFRGDEFVVSVFEPSEPVALVGASGSVEATLERIDEIAAVFVDSATRDLGADLGRITGLRFQPAGPGADGLRADAPAEDGWALGAELRSAGESRVLTVELGGRACVRSADVTARHGSDARPIPVSPHRSLPASWHLEYTRPWGSLRFSFRMARPHDYDDCLVEIGFRRDVRQQDGG